MTTWNLLQLLLWWKSWHRLSGGLSDNKAFISLVITFFFCLFFIALFGLMPAKVCNTCNKSVSCRNLIKYSLCLTMVHLKCNYLNVVDAEIIKNTGSDRFWICMFCSNNLFPFATLNDHQTLSESNNHYSGSSNSYISLTVLQYIINIKIS